MQRSGMLCIVPAPLTHKHSSGPNERSFTDKSECFNFVFVFFFFLHLLGLCWLWLAHLLCARACEREWLHSISRFDDFQTRHVRFCLSNICVSADLILAIFNANRVVHTFLFQFFFFVVHHILRRRIHQSNDNASQQQQATKAKLNDLNF